MTKINVKDLADEAQQDHTSEQPEQKERVSRKDAREIVTRAFRSLSRKLNDGDYRPSDVLRAIESADQN